MPGHAGPRCQRRIVSEYVIAVGVGHRRLSREQETVWRHASNEIKRTDRIFSYQTPNHGLPSFMTRTARQIFEEGSTSAIRRRIRGRRIHHGIGVQLYWRCKSAAIAQCACRAVPPRIFAYRRSSIAWPRPIPWRAISPAPPARWWATTHWSFRNLPASRLPSGLPTSHSIQARYQRASVAVRRSR